MILVLKEKLSEGRALLWLLRYSKMQLDVYFFFAANINLIKKNMF